MGGLIWEERGVGSFLPGGDGEMGPSSRGREEVDPPHPLRVHSTFGEEENMIPCRLWREMEVCRPRLLEEGWVGSSGRKEEWAHSIPGATGRWTHLPGGERRWTHPTL